MDEQRQDDQLEPTYSSSVLIWECSPEDLIEKGGERGSEISILMARYDDDDDLKHIITGKNLGISTLRRCSLVFFASAWFWK